MKYSVYIPTYNKDSIAILDVLKSNPKLTINLCVREEEFERYQKFASNRCIIKNLGTDIHNLGETRKRIQLMSLDLEDDYCIMLDDDISDVYYLEDKDKENRLVLAIEKAISAIENDELSNIIFMYSFWRQGQSFIGVKDTDKYIRGQAIQCFILNNKVCYNNQLLFEDMKICGLEDTAFMLDGLKKGLITLGSPNTDIIGKRPNHLKLGGSHSNTNSNDFEKLRDKSQEVLMNYVGNMYGVVLEKKYHESIPGFCTYVRIDCEYFRDVLIYHRKENQKIIDKQFIVDKGENV